MNLIKNDNYEMHRVSAKNKEVRKMIKFFLDILMPEIEADIEVIKESIKDFNGSVGPIRYGSEVAYFEMALAKNLDQQELIITVAHECVHIRQYARDGLIYGYKHAKWNGEKFEIDTDSPEYFMQPWELEAFALQEVLYHCWTNRNSKKVKKWIKQRRGNI